MTVYPDVANPDLLDRIPLDARVVLDVGCRMGALGAEYKRRNPAARYLGIELDPEAAHIAAGRIDQVAVCDVEADPLPFAELADGQPVDCVIYGDVLEHLRDPWSVLERHAQALSDTGTVLICMPNVEHWSFVERLLRGTWDYEDQGLFDADHVRWFSFESTRRALVAAGLTPHDVAPRIFNRPEIEGFVRAIEPALVRLGIDPQAYIQRAAPLQYVWRALKQPVQQLALVSTMLKPVGGVSHVRVLEPLRALATVPALTTMVVRETDPLDLPLDLPRIFIFHRPLLAGEAGLEPVRALIAAGYVVVCEFDDHPDYIPVLQRPDVQNFRAVHAIQTSTQPLADVLRQQNPEVEVFANAISRLPDPRNYTRPDGVTLLFGGINREQDWPPFISALNAVAATAGERLHFQIISDRGLFDALRTPFKSFTPLCDYDTYLDLMARSEIAWMPLLDTPFNRCKSDLKFLEASAHRVTSLASPVVYGASIEDGRTGVLFHSADDLQQRLLRLVASPAMGRAMADAARKTVAETRMMAYQVERRVAWYRSLWARRDELNRALLERVPELAAAGAVSPGGPPPIVAPAPNVAIGAA